MGVYVFDHQRHPKLHRLTVKRRPNFLLLRPQTHPTSIKLSWSKTSKIQPYVLWSWNVTAFSTSAELSDDPVEDRPFVVQNRNRRKVPESYRGRGALKTHVKSTKKKGLLRLSHLFLRHPGWLKSQKAKAPRRGMRRASAALASSRPFRSSLKSLWQGAGGNDPMAFCGSIAGGFIPHPNLVPLLTFEDWRKSWNRAAYLILPTKRA